MTAAGDIWTSMPWPAGWDVGHVAETASTNTDLLAAIESGAAGPRTVLAADHQSAGRGRLDRRWEAPAGANLLVSIVLPLAAAAPSETTQRVGLAALQASRAVIGDGVALGLKWPNDVLLDGAKLAGVLAQRSPGRDLVVVGLGLNVGWAPDGAASLAQVHDAAYANAANADAANADAADGLLHPAVVLREVLVALDGLDALDHAALAAAYRRSLATIGEVVRVELPDGSALVGTAVDVDDAGRLVVDAAGERHVLDVGDVVHVRRH